MRSKLPLPLLVGVALLAVAPLVLRFGLGPFQPMLLAPSPPLWAAAGACLASVAAVALGVLVLAASRRRKVVGLSLVLAALAAAPLVPVLFFLVNVHAVHMAPAYAFLAGACWAWRWRDS